MHKFSLNNKLRQRPLHLLARSETNNGSVRQSQKTKATEVAFVLDRHTFN